MVLSKQDLAALKKVLDRAIVENLAVRRLDKLSEADGLSPEAMEVLHSLTEAEVKALRSLYKRAKKHGAEEEHLKVYGPIH